MPSPSGQPSIELFGITIMEPMVTFTDLWITAVCIYAFIQLKKLNKPGREHQYMRWYFAIMGLATFLGGILGHAFQYAIGIEWKLPGWIISMVAVMAIERASIMHAKPILKPRFAKILGAANVAEFIVFAIITFFTLNFFFIKVHSAYGLGLVVLPINFWVYWKTRNEGSRIYVLTVLFASLSAIFYIAEIGISIWFNHLDVAHTIMAISMYFFYRGTLVLEVMKREDILEDKRSFWETVRELFVGRG